MRDDWSKIKELGSKIGDDLDVTSAWNEFDNRRKKKRRFSIILFNGVLSFALLLSLFSHISNNNSGLANTGINHEPVNSIVKNEKPQTPLTIDQPLPRSTTRILSKPFESLNEDTGKHHIDHSRRANEFTYRQVNESEYIQFKQTPSSDVEAHKPIRRNNVYKLEIKGKEESKHKPFLVSKLNVHTNAEKSERKNSVSSKKVALKIQSDRGNAGLSQIPFLPIQVLPLSFQNPEQQFLVSEPMVNLKNRRWAIALQYSFGLPSRTLLSSENLLTQRRAENEKLLEAQAFSILLRHQMSNNIFVESGIGVGVIRSKLQDEVQELLTDVIYADQITAILNQNGQRIEIIGDVVGSQTIIKEHVRFQNYVDIKIPLMVGYQVILNRASRLEFMGGVQINFFQRSNGNTYKEYFSSGDYQPLQSLGYKKNGLLQLAGAFNFATRINDEFEVVLGINGAADISNRMSSPHDIDKFSKIGVHFGFFKRL